MIRPQLVFALKKSKFSEEAKIMVGNHDSYYDLWISSFADRFYDMGNMIRLGSAIESCFKQYYMQKKGIANIPALKVDPGYRPNIFLRVQSFQPDGVITLLNRE